MAREPTPIPPGTIKPPPPPAPPPKAGGVPNIPDPPAPPPKQEASLAYCKFCGRGLLVGDPRSGMMTYVSRCPGCGHDYGAQERHAVLVAKLDALTELVEALGELVEGMAEAVVASPDAERRLALALLMARRRGRCTTCLGVGFGRNEVWDKVPCSACNGTGKAKQGDGDG